MRLAARGILLKAYMTYQPNINDPRVLKRIKHAYGYARGVFDETKPTTRSQQAIDKRFGVHSNPLSKWLRTALLTCVDHHYSNAASISKKYILNKESADDIRALLQSNAAKVFIGTELAQIKPHIGNAKKFDALVVAAFAERDFSDELASGDFEYKDKSDRLWHPLQSVRKDYRKQIMSRNGYSHHYDIQSCAITLLTQHSRQLGNDESPESIHRLLTDRKAYRQYIAEEVEIDADEAKQVLNALFCGARLGLNSQFALTDVLHHDAARIVYMRELTEELREDIKTMWSYITPTMTRTRSDTGRLIPINSSAKWARYFRLERQVMDSVRKYLKQTNNKHFLEHDGWACEYAIDEEALLHFIKQDTGFSIQLEHVHVTELDAASALRSPAIESLPTLASSLQHTDSIATSATKDLYICYPVTVISPCSLQVQPAAIFDPEPINAYPIDRHHSGCV